MTQADYNRQLAHLKATEPAETIPATPERRAWEQALLELIFGTTIEDLHPNAVGTPWRLDLIRHPS